MYSNRRPYLNLKDRVLDAYRRAGRFFGASEELESMLEKPYRQQDYRAMHLDPDTPSSGAGTEQPVVTPGALKCFYNPTNCELGAYCYAGSDIKIAGGPQIATAGYLDPIVTAGDIISKTISGTENRRIDLVVDHFESSAIVQVRFRDGWGNIHTSDIDMSCGVSAASWQTSWTDANLGSFTGGGTWSAPNWRSVNDVNTFGDPDGTSFLWQAGSHNEITLFRSWTENVPSSILIETTATNAYLQFFIYQTDGSTYAGTRYGSGIMTLTYSGPGRPPYAAAPFAKLTVVEYSNPTLYIIDIKQNGVSKFGPTYWTKDIFGTWNGVYYFTHEVDTSYGSYFMYNSGIILYPVSGLTDFATYPFSLEFAGNIEPVTLMLTTVGGAGKYLFHNYISGQTINPGDHGSVPVSGVYVGMNRFRQDAFSMTNFQLY